MTDPAKAEFFVDCRPVPKARARVVRSRKGSVRAYTPATTVQMEALVKAAYFKQCGLRYFDRLKSLRLTLEVVCPGRGNQSAIRGDADNYHKVVADALNKVAYFDDVQIVEWAGVKRRAAKGEKTGVLVRIETV